MLQIVQADLLRGEVAFKSIFDVLEAAGAVQHSQDRVFLFLKPVILQADRFLDHPKRFSQIAMVPDREIRSHPQRQTAVMHWKPGYRKA